MASGDPTEHARAKREAAQAAAAAVHKRNRNLLVLAGTVVAAILVVVVVVVIAGGSKHSGGDPDKIAGAAETKTLLSGVAQNGLTLGDPKAPITVLEFLDVQCPFCKAHQLDEQPVVIKNLVRTGRVQLKMQPVALPQMGEDSVAGRAVLLRAGHQNKAWDFLNVFYFNQGEEATGYVTPAFLTSLLRAIPGAPTDTSRTLDARDAATAAAIDKAFQQQAAKYEAKGQSFGTPAFALAKTGSPAAGFSPVFLTGNGNASDLIAAVDKLEKSL